MVAKLMVLIAHPSLQFLHFFIVINTTCLPCSPNYPNGRKVKMGLVNTTKHFTTSSLKCCGFQQLLTNSASMIYKTCSTLKPNLMNHTHTKNLPSQIKQLGRTHLVLYYTVTIVLKQFSNFVHYNKMKMFTNLSEMTTNVG